MTRRAPRLIGRALWLIVLAASVLICFAGCSAGHGPAGRGPAGADSGWLQYLHAAGQSQPLVNGGAIPVLPGQAADFTVTVDNPTATPVRLLSAVVIPAPHYPAAHLAHVGVAADHDMVGAGRGWPGHVRVGPFAGASLAHGQSNIIIGVTGGAPGRDYAVAGLRIAYRSGGQVRYLKAWSVGVACVRATIGPVYPGCPATLGNVITAVRRVLHLPA
jgi:hypothetical protein